RPPVPEPVGQDPRPRAEDKRTGELGAGHQADPENRMRQLVGEHYLRGVLQPGAEVGDHAAEEVPGEPGLGQYLPVGAPGAVAPGHAERIGYLPERGDGGGADRPAAGRRLAVVVSWRPGRPGEARGTHGAAVS